MTIKYRTSDGQADYEFSFEKTPNGDWQAYILSQPSYGRRSASPNETHTLTASDGRRYICWASPLHSVDEVKQVAALWSERTQRYITSGTPISEP